MCLDSKQILPRRATKDIIVYKEMVHIQNSNIYRTPFLYYTVTSDCFGDIKFAESKKEVYKGKYKSIFTEQYITEIGSGYFHCHRIIPLFKGMNRYGSYSINGNRIKYNTQWRVIECTIPKGSLYWVGTRNDICSDKLIFNKVLSEEEINQILYNK